MKVLNFLLSLAAWPVVAFANADLPSQGAACCVTQALAADILKLPFEAFDQNPHGGWRPYAEKGCYQTAALLLNQYRERNANNLQEKEMRILTWHAGQVSAFMGDYVTARQRFVASFDLHESADSTWFWNDYVIATIAFLDHDLEILKAHRNKIARGLASVGRPIDVRVEDGFIQYFDEPYGKAYRGGQPPAPPITCWESNHNSDVR